MQDAYQAGSGEVIDFTRYSNTEHDLALCYTNDMVDAINATWNAYHSKTQHQIFAADGFKNTRYIVYGGLKLIAYMLQITLDITPKSIQLI